jgi:hypothetical protein
LADIFSRGVPNLDIPAPPVDLPEKRLEDYRSCAMFKAYDSYSFLPGIVQALHTDVVVLQGQADSAHAERLADPGSYLPAAVRNLQGE